MLEFLVRVFSVMTAGVFMIAMVFGVLSEFLGISLGNKSLKNTDLPKVEKKVQVEQTLASDLTASLYQLDSKIELKANDLSVDDKKEVTEVVKLEINSVEDLKSFMQENKVLVLLDNSSLSSFLYEEKNQVLTEVLKIHKDYVETTKGGMIFKGGSIYTHLDFMEAFKAAGGNFELLSL
ncbi:hypothetical protein CL656_04650 [bacterium]|nr:hypothetical protein [bacterium]|tara:strand:+ start:61 stop:597 length:537 start_codon:yes stop_codon:yes gene_type:complete